ncbi:hypothetical protein ACT7DF_17560 [Bacillus cereus]
MFKSLNVPWNYMGKRETFSLSRLGLTVDEDQKLQTILSNIAAHVAV